MTAAVKHEAVSTGTSLGPAFVRGEGAWLYDESGRRYFDGTAGSGAVSLGHQHPKVLAAAAEQMSQLVHTGCKLSSVVRDRLTERLAALAPFADAAVLPTATGSEGMEALLKVARAATGRRVVVAFEHAFHGKTAGSLGLTWREGLKRYSSVLRDEVVTARLPEPDQGTDTQAAQRCLESVRDALARAAARGGAAAVVMEPVQVTEGVRTVAPELVDAIADAARQAGALFALDEIYTGFGRTGRLLFSDRLRQAPDLLLVGKPLGNGFPISVVLGEAELVNQLPAGVQTSTYSGHPLSCAAACAVLDVVEQDDVAGQAMRRENDLLRTMRELADRHPWVTGARAIGALGAFDCRVDGEPAPQLAARFARSALDEGLLLFTGGPQDCTVKLVPPILLDEDERAFLHEALMSTAHAVGM
ncbi:MAG TPA: aspartate aminotransferase family protein [Actinocrinis sp.]|uniref:aspartate aminotransferase family protein n=1 Tax=Actinocrinis sp. TaxID=1920516 RepID=UPI002DDDB08E|nr:aspartate aminotransferase family protein [Actinocrinis sp.]HEV2343015.1 aspartate aminotransferase family protein [Actinocrinis sp.]